MVSSYEAAVARNDISVALYAYAAKMNLRQSSMPARWTLGACLEHRVLTAYDHAEAPPEAYGWNRTDETVRMAQYGWTTRFLLVLIWVEMRKAHVKENI